MENFSFLQAWFLSDIHLNDLNERNGKTLLHFFRSIVSGELKATHVFLLGDIFDLWIADHSYFIKKYAELISLIKEVKKKEIEIHFFEGNHDFHLRSYWQEELGVTVHSNEAHFRLGSFRVRAEHGDLINSNDTSYLRWRRFIRSSFIKIILFSLPGSVVSSIGERLSKASRLRQEKKHNFNEAQALKLIRSYAHNLCEEIKGSNKEFDYIFTGHVHVRDEYNFEFAGRRVHSVNLGFWGKESQIYCLNDSGGKFHLFSPSPVR